MIVIPQYDTTGDRDQQKYICTDHNLESKRRGMIQHLRRKHKMEWFSLYRMLNEAPLAPKGEAQ